MAKKKTAKKAGARGKGFWLARDEQDASKGAHGCYALYLCRPISRPSGFWIGDDDCVSAVVPEAFHRCADKSVHLPPGGGPIRVRLVGEEEA